eukprot:NODE_5_length_72347_cov_1.339331.p50 type:complete len:144 gc:universal NODE_5_length_72347_cov_1.339331:1104-673(-)
MRIVIQRVLSASVSVEKKVISEIGQGLVLLVGLLDGDTDDDLDWCVNKCLNLRLFNSWSDNAANKDILSISQFTLAAKTKKGTKPDFRNAMGTAEAEKMYNVFLDKLKQRHGKVLNGQFGKMMVVNIQNDGPVTICIDSKNRE